MEGQALPNMNISGLNFKLDAFVLGAASAETLRNESSPIFDLFLRRETEFGVHPSVEIDYPDLADTSTSGFLTDAAAYVAKRLAALAETAAVHRIVVLTTYSDIVGPSFAAAGYKTVPIDMPAGPDHTAAFLLGPTPARGDGRTLYVEAVNEADEKIRPSFVLKLTDTQGQLCGGAYGVVHDRQGKRYAYLATMTLASAMPQGSGTAMVQQLVQFLRSQGVSTVHLGTQTAGGFYEKMGFRVDHRLVRSMRTRQQGGKEVLGDLVMLSMDI
ncbi:MAG: GNAT family N-acetyltransferase [Giesbergeria sp.]